MAQNYIAALSTNPAANTDFIGVGVLGSDLVSTADNAFRANGGMLARFYSDFGGTGVTAGTANAITITTPSAYTAYTTGIRLRFIASAANSGAVTVNVDAVGAKAIRKISGGTDVALVTGDILAAVGYEIVYSTAANAAAGGWIINPEIGVGSVGGLGAGVATFLATPTSVNLKTAVTDETGSGALVFGTSPTFTTSILGAGDLLIDDTAGTNFTIKGTKVLLWATGAGSSMELDAGTVSPGIVLTRGQLAFPATQNASSNANTLDDYEKGTGTPNLGGTTTYSAQFLRYTKVGNFVDGSIRLVVTLIGTGSANTISGLPYTSATGDPSGGFHVNYWASLASTPVFLCGYVNNAATTIQMNGATAAAATMTSPISTFGNSATVYGTFNYQAA